MNWLSKLLAAITLVPGVIQGIETIHGSAKTGADKKTLALQSLGLAGAVAENLAPEDKLAIDGVTAVVGHLIDDTVQLFNVQGWQDQQALAGAAVTPAKT